MALLHFLLLWDNRSAPIGHPHVMRQLCVLGKLQFTLSGFLRVPPLIIYHPTERAIIYRSKFMGTTSYALR
jgi:hypothetical protein